MTDELNKLNDAVEGQDAEMPQSCIEKRREERYAVPELYRRYITMEVKSNGRFVPALLGNFSRSGILFESPACFKKGDHTDCMISISLLLSRDISFGVTVMYCYKNNDSYIVGASIDSISDETWFDVFVEVHDFIVTRQA
jgi:hypothetical protein